MAIWVEPSSFEWYCDACDDCDRGFESEDAAQRDGDQHNELFHGGEE